MSKKEAFRKGMTIESLMKLRTGTADHHLAAANFDDVLDEMIDLKKRLAKKDEVIHSLQADAMSDPLTEVANRRTFEKELKRSLSVARRYGRMHGLLLIDVDDFKQVNDQLGHTMGDKVLCHIARLLRQNIRATDIVSRLGGDEFCVILNELKSRDNAMMRARAITDVVRQTPCVGENQTIQVSISVGHYVFGADDEPEMILQRADESMYTQKSRNKDMS
jgi:diguanylate cyclase (GGDEF)-like protein